MSLRCFIGWHAPAEYEYHLVGLGGKARCARCRRVGLVDSHGGMFGLEGPRPSLTQDERVVLVALLLAAAAFVALLLRGPPLPDEAWLRLWGS